MDYQILCFSVIINLLNSHAVGMDSWVLTRGRHWDLNPMGSQSQSQIFGIGTGIEFENFWDWDWDSFFLKLGLGLRFFCRPLVLTAAKSIFWESIFLDQLYTSSLLSLNSFLQPFSEKFLDTKIISLKILTWTLLNKFYLRNK